MNDFTDKTLSAWTKTECKNAIDSFTLNNLIVKPKKFQVVLLSKGKSDLTNLQLKIDYKVIKPISSVELFGVTLYGKLNITFISASLVGQLQIS